MIVCCSLQALAYGGGGTTPCPPSDPKNKKMYKQHWAVYGKMFNFRRITLFCLEKRLSKHKMTIFSKNLGGQSPFVPPGYAYAFPPSKIFCFPPSEIHATVCRSAVLGSCPKFVIHPLLQSFHAWLHRIVTTSQSSH